jgi:hypothetical protein
MMLDAVEHRSEKRVGGKSTLVRPSTAGTPICGPSTDMPLFMRRSLKIPEALLGAELAIVGIASPMGRSTNVTMIIQIVTNRQISYN